MAHRRRNRVDRRAATVVVLVSVASALGGAFAGCEPTGNDVVDVLLTAALAAFTTWAAASAPWWALAAAGGVAALFAGGWLLVGVAAVAVAVALWIGERKRSLAWQRAVSAALTVQVLLRLGADLPFGVTALIAAAGVALITISGVARRRRPVRRRVVIGVAVLGGLAVLAGVGLGVAGAASRTALRDGYDGLQDGLDLLQAGEPAEAASALRTAASDLDQAAASLERPWTWPSAAVPVLAQHRSVLTTVVGEASSAAEAAAAALDVVDLDRLSVVDGVIDVEAVAALAEPLARLEATVQQLDAAVADAESPWLVAPAQDRLADARDDTADAAHRATNVRTVADVAPTMLGESGPRRYLLAFTSPGEARGLGGVMGNWSEITADGGQLSETASGRTAALVDGLAADGDAALQMPAEYHDRYWRFGSGRTGDRVTAKYWSNVTLPAHGPYVGEAMAQMYEQATGRAVDGVFLLDASGLADLLGVTGPMTVDGWPEPLTQDNLEQFLLTDQYQLPEAEREVLLSAVSAAVVEALLSGELPPPQDLADQLGPAAVAGHITGWAADPAEQAMLALVGMDGALAALDGRDGLALVTSNASGNKIDSYLQRSLTYTATADEETGAVRGVAEVTLRNDAPTSGLPDYVIGNLIGRPPGTSRSYVSLYSALGVVGASVDGEPVEVGSDTEAGWNVASLFVEIAPGEQVTLRVELVGVIDPGAYELVVRPQPTVRPDQVSVSVSSNGGDPIVTFDGELTRPSLLSADGVEPVR